jgi:integrase
MKAREIELDILAGHFDQTLAKYKPQSSLSVTSPDIKPKVTPSLPELWKRYSETKQSGKSPATVKVPNTSLI